MRPISVLALAVSLISGACESVPDAPIVEQRGALAEAEHARLRLRFLLHGQPAPATLIVATARSRQVFADVRAVDALVPRVATHTLLMKDPASGAVVFKDVIPSLSVPAAGLDADIHLIEGERATEFEPMLLIEERGADALVRSRITHRARGDGAFELRAEIRGTPGKQVILDTILDPPTAPRGFTCPAPCPLIYPDPAQLGVDCSVYCYGCSSTAVLKGDHWVGNHNLCSLTLDTGGHAQRQAVLAPLPKGHGGVALLAALRDDAAVTTHLATLRSVDAHFALRPPLAERSYPDFVVPEGTYVYELAVDDPSVPAGVARFALPMPVEDGSNRAFLLNLPALASLQPFTAHALGDSGLGLALRGARAARDGALLRIDADLDESEGTLGWVLVALPADAVVGAIEPRADKECPPGALRRGVDYAVSRGAGLQLLTLAVTRERASFAVRLESAR